MAVGWEGGEVGTSLMIGPSTMCQQGLDPLASRSLALGLRHRAATFLLSLHLPLFPLVKPDLDGLPCRAAAHKIGVAIKKWCC